MEDNKNTIIITCPHCHAEYVLDEIYYRDDFSGHPKNIIKDPLGKILYVEYKEGYEPTFTQHYICDHCGKSFIAEATLDIKTSAEPEEKDFSEEYVSLL